jgi:hypothetical protein
MILNKIREEIENSYRSQSPMSAFKYSEGYITGLKRYGIINLSNFNELNNYNHKIFEHSLDVDIGKIRGDIGRYSKLLKER